MRIILIISIMALSLSAIGQGKVSKFTIKGDIIGIKAGDTLRFSSVNLPTYQMQPAFDIVVKRNNKFSYSGHTNHTSEYYSMTYCPKDGGEISMSKNALDILISSGKYRIDGDVKSIYMSSISGGQYNNILHREMAHLEDSIEISRSEILSKLSDTTLNVDEKQRYSNQFNDHRNINKEAYDRLLLLRKRFSDEALDSELLAVNMLLRLTSTDHDKLENVYNRLFDEVKSRRYGTLLGEHINILSKLNNGNDAPYFSLKTDSTSITLTDLKGKYVLLYHWGLCPGSMSIDSRVLKLHQDHKSEITVIGITEFRQDVVNLLKNSPEGSTVMGMDLNAIMRGFLSHPYKDFEIQKQESNISETYMFGGLPFFVLISPEGKILGRGFFETFYQAENLFSRH